MLGRPEWREEQLIEDSEDMSPTRTALESAIASQIRGFKRDIEGALRGRALKAARTLANASGARLRQAQ